MKYVIITPVHNEEAYLRFTLESVVAQTVRPQQWMIVDDGSTDGTARIIEEYVGCHAWIERVTLPAGAGRELGARVVRVFCEGLRQLEADYDFLVKLDGDLEFGPDYFERLLAKFAEDPRLGIAGGGFYILVGNQWQLEKVPVDHVRGATKVYSRACYADIGGLKPVNGWDGVDEWRAQMKGWKTRSYNELVVHHLRPTGASFGKWGGSRREGEEAFFLGYPWLVVMARSLYRGVSGRPPLVRGAGIFWGYLRSWLSRKPQLDDAEVVAYMRRKQMRRITSFWRAESS